MTLLERALLAVLAAGLIAAAAAGWVWRRERAETRSARLRADSLAAALDTSHAIALSQKDSTRILGDSLQAVGRRAFQVDPRTDALDRALGLQSAAIAELTATVRRLEISVVSVQQVHVDSVSGDRSATFAIVPDTTTPAKPPYRGTAAVTLPASGTGRMRLEVLLPPARLGLRLGCGQKVNGIRSASATLIGPPWLQLEIGRVDQAAEVCNPVTPTGSWLRRLLARCGAGPGGAVILAEDRKLHAGVGAVAACNVL